MAESTSTRSARAASGSYPEGERYNRFIKRRQDFGRFWHGAFFFATLLGVVFLVVLLAHISNNAFGYVAIQNKVSLQSLITGHFKQQVLNAPNLLAKEDQAVLAANIAKRPAAIGFLDTAIFEDHTQDLKQILIDGAQVLTSSTQPDASLVVVTSAKNTFLGNITKTQLQQAFTAATRWSEVDPAWPDQPILHYIPAEGSPTLDLFTTAVLGGPPSEQPATVLAEILTENVRAGRMRALQSGKPLEQRTPAELLQLIESEILNPSVAETWTLYESLFERQRVQAEADAIPGDVNLAFRSWVNWDFVTNPQSSDPLKAGIATAIWGSLWVTLLAFLVAIPLGVAAAVYLEEYNTGKSRLDQVIETNINNLAGVPSIIYGMLGLAVFVRFLGPLTSGIAFGVNDPATANGRTIMSAGLTLGVLILPLVIINAREAIRAVPRAMREGAMGLGATKWQAIWHHVLPSALPGILTGVILAVSRAFGETAPLIVVGVSTFIVVNPDSIFSKYTTLPAQIYQWTSRPQQEFQHLAAAAIIVLLLLLVSLNAAAILLRNRYSRRA